jgi:hypothetical protein
VRDPLGERREAGGRRLLDGVDRDAVESAAREQLDDLADAGRRCLGDRERAGEVVPVRVAAQCVAQRSPDQQRGTGGEDAAQLGRRGRAVVDVVDDVGHQRGVRARVAERYVLGAAGPVGDALVSVLGLGHRAHPLRGLHADDVRVLERVGEHGRVVPDARPDVDHGRGAAHPVAEDRRPQAPVVG